MAQGQTRMSAGRDTILNAIRSGRGEVKFIPIYRLPLSNEDPAERFAAKAAACVAGVHRIAGRDDVPETIFALLSAANAKLSLHLPVQSVLNDLPWQRAPGLTILREPPSGVDAAFACADYGIAETGTLVYLSSPKSPSSWHYRPGREIVLLDKSLILPRMEDLFARIKSLPATMNLVTGPSRTADIEQTIELGAHGPHALDILIAG
jgi:L-lactate dehydrogenase complex protein LldG